MIVDVIIENKHHNVIIMSKSLYAAIWGSGVDTLEVVTRIEN